MPATDALDAARRTALVLAGAGVAGLLLWLSVHFHLDRSCVVADTPYLPHCPETATPGSAQHVQELRRRIAANPGDSLSYAGLAHFALGPELAGPVRAASALAPNNPNVLRARAAVSLNEQRFPEAVALLVQLAEDHHLATQEPARALARLIGAGSGGMLQQHLVQGSRWFARVLDQMVELKLPLATALPLVTQAASLGLLAPARMSELIGQLKAAGAWVDAYGLWLSQHGSRLPILYNASFEQPLTPLGFDWELPQAAPSRAGVVADRRPMSGRGHVLDLQFTGRSVEMPMVRQYLFLGAGRYRLQGEYMTQRLRMDGGLAWAVRCSSAATNEPAGRSMTLGDTAGAWKPFEFDFTVPGSCGPVASLQLETFAPYEATAGFRGHASFDAFSVKLVSP